MSSSQTQEIQNHATEHTPLVQLWPETDPGLSSPIARMSDYGATMPHAQTEESPLSWAETMYRFEYDEPASSRGFMEEGGPELGVIDYEEEEGGKGSGYWASSAVWMIAVLVVTVLFCGLLLLAVRMEG